MNIKDFHLRGKEPWLNGQGFYLNNYVVYTYLFIFLGKSKYSLEGIFEWNVNAIQAIAINSINDDRLKMAHYMEWHF
jgi:hypothetical protein